MRTLTIKTLVLGMIGLPALLVGAHYLSQSQPAVAETVDDPLLAIVRQGMDETVSSIKSGKGTITVTDWQKNENGSVVQTETEYEVAFRGDQYRLSVQTRLLQNDPARDAATGQPVEVGTLSLSEAAYDGETLTWYFPVRGEAVVGDLASGETKNHHTRYIVDVSLVGHGLSRLARPQELPSFITETAGPRVVAREMLNGDECVVIEYLDTYNMPNGRRQTNTRWLWVNPSRSYTIPLVRNWMEGDGFPSKTLTTEVNTEVRQYADGIWVPSRVSVEYFQRNPDTGQSERSRVKTRVYDPDFRLNVPVSEADLALALPSGTEVHDEIRDARYTVP